MENPFIIILLIAVFLLLLIIGMYNNLIKKKNAVDNAFYSIDVMLRKRYDLIPQLVETVKGYMQYEKQVLTEITELRSRAIATNTSTNDKVTIDNQISLGLQKIMVSVEKYPDLKASRNFLELQGAMNETEEQLAASRRFYNAAVTEYHNAVETFPSSMIASMAGLKKRSFFEISEEQRQVPQVKFS